MRVRFAPSPTGALHIGGARTALYNWLLAQQAPENRLVLRIEDTDRERSTPENVEQILDALGWLDLDWDEGPIFQSDRADRHREVLTQLLESGHAYRSTATAEDVKAYKQQHGSDRGFRGTPEDTGAVRLRVPDTGATVVTTSSAGTPRSSTCTSTTRSSPAPTAASSTTSPSRSTTSTPASPTSSAARTTSRTRPSSCSCSRRWASSRRATPTCRSCTAPTARSSPSATAPPRCRSCATPATSPEAVRNYIALLGWGYDDETTLLSTEQMIEGFRLDRVSRNPAVFDEQKLRWMNGRYLRELPLDELTRRLEQFTGRTGIEGAVAIAQDKMQTLADFEPLCAFIFDGPADDPAAFDKVIGKDGGAENLVAARAALAATEPFDQEHVETALRGVVEERGVKPRQVFQPLRVALAGSTVSPGIFETVALLGRDETLRRVDDALAKTTA